MSIKPKIRLRALALLSTRRPVSPDLAERFAARRASLMARFGRDAELVLALRRADDPFAAIGGERRVEPADAFLQVSLPGTAHSSDLLRNLSGLSAALDDLFVLEQSALAVGIAYLMVERTGGVFCSFLGRRDPKVTVQEMRDWWLYHHAPLGISLTVARAPHGYDQLHVDHELSRRAAEAAGFPYVPYDMADSLYISDLDAFVRGTSDPEIARRLYEDEVGFLDHSSWRGAFADIV